MQAVAAARVITVPQMVPVAQAVAAEVDKTETQPAPVLLELPTLAVGAAAVEDQLQRQEVRAAPELSSSKSRGNQ